MLINDLYESRKNPDVNTKESIYDFLLKHADDPNAYIHMSHVDKVGINPKSAKRHGHDTPVGIFAFHLGTFKKDILHAQQHGLSKALIFPYYGGSYWFILSGTEPHRDTKTVYTESDLKHDVDALSDMFDPELVKQSLSIAHTNENYVNAPIGKLWGMTKAIAIGGTSELSHQQYPDALKWNRMLRRLGHHAFHDMGDGWIHGAESSQSLFLDTTAFEIIDAKQVDTHQKETTIDRQTYVGGRLPKVINMISLNSTELMNIDTDNPANQRVQEINIQSIRDINDLSRLSNIFKNANITIDKVTIRDINSLPRLGLPPKVSINTLVFDDFPTLPSELGKLSSISSRVKTFGYPSHTGLEDNVYLWDRIPSHLQSKIKGV